MSKFLAALGLAIMLWLPQHANANTCLMKTSDGRMGRLRLPPVAWDGSFDPNSIAVGGVIKDILVQTVSIENPEAGKTYGGWDCYPEQSGDQERKGTTGAYQMMTINALGGSVAVYPTTVPGIGVHITYNPGAGQPFGFPQTLTGQTNTSYIIATSFSLHFVLVKTGPITQGGVLTGEVAGDFLLAHGNQQIISYLWTDTPIRPQVPTCVPTVADKVVDMGNVDAGSVAADGYSSSVAFNMDVVCSGGVPVDKTQAMSVTFTDATDTTNTTDKLTLTSASTATGVKVQLLQGGTPVTFGPEPTNGADTTYSRALGTIQNGTYSFPLAARYVKTGSTVTAGSANAIATFTYTYH